ncbi:MAG: LacI family DNA-binding transcriptional regulator [Roseovarius sp.]
MKKRVTLSDVAREAKVSNATVSLALRDSPQIPQSTKRAIRATAERIGYVYNQSAANLRSQNQNLFGMVMSGSANRFNADLVSDLSRKCAEKGRLMLYGDADESLATQRQIVTRMVENNVGGVFVCAAEGSSAEDFAMLTDYGIPVVQVLRKVQGMNASYIGFDNASAADIITTRLIESGHRRIAFLGGSREASSREERFTGYQKALRRAGIDADASLDIATPVTRREGYKAMERLLALPEPPSAVFCYNDILAFGAMLHLTASGIQAGRDIAIAGFDDLPEAELWVPSLTSAYLDRNALVEEAFEQMLRAKETRYAANVVIEPRPVFRASTQDWAGARQEGAG